MWKILNTKNKGVWVKKQTKKKLRQIQYTFKDLPVCVSTEI